MSRSGTGAHTWVFFTGPVPAEGARRLGAGLLREAMALRGQPQPGSPSLLAVATGPYAGEGFDCPVLDTLFLAAPVRWKGRLVQYAGRILRPHSGKATAEIHDYHDTATGGLAATLAGRAPGYTSLGFPDPRRITPTPSAQSPVKRANHAQTPVAKPPELTGPDMTDRL